MKWELIVAFRYIVTKQKDRFISVINLFSMIGIALGVATLIIVMSVMNGYEKELIQKILSFNSHISILNIQNMSDAHEIKNKLQNAPNTSSVNIVQETQAMIGANNNFTGALIKGVEKSYIETPPAGLKIRADLNADGIILGKGLAANLSVNVGDTVQIVSSQFTDSAFGPIPTIITMNVIGLADTEMYEYNASLAMLNISLIPKLLSGDDADADYAEEIAAPMPAAHDDSLDDSEKDTTLQTKIEIRLVKANNIQQNRNYIAQIIQQHFNNLNLQAIDWTTTNKSLSNALKTERNVMFIILSLIIMIAVFNIISGLVILVKDKSKGIAILKTMGATKASIIRIFMLCGFTIGFIGTIFGAIIGVLFTTNIDNIRLTIEKITGTVMFDPVVYFLTTLPSELDWYQTLLVILMALLFSFLATIYPAIKIANSSPTNILRYE